MTGGGRDRETVPAVTKSHPPESRRLRHGAQQAGLRRAEPAGEVGNGQDPDVLRPGPEHPAARNRRSVRRQDARTGSRPSSSAPRRTPGSAPAPRRRAPRCRSSRSRRRSGSRPRSPTRSGPEARSGPAPPPQPCSPACAGRRGMRGPGRGRRCRQSAWLRQAGSEWERLVQDCQKVASLNSYGPVSTDSVDEQFARRDSLGL